MRRDHNLDTDKHRSNRSILRIIGPLVLIAGIILTLIGFSTFVTGFGQSESFGAPPPGFKRFFLAFLGLPMIAFGAAMTKFAFMGAVARYASSEIAPVGKDTANYMIDGTKDAVSGLAQSVGSGLAAGLTGQATDIETVACPGCDEACDSGARFCSQCGTAIPGEVRCERCGAMNEPDARFCDQCGRSTGA
ncbi:MAG: double zinc ribbon domain-containing protein [Phycisphaeraceae bacterium]